MSHLSFISQILETAVYIFGGDGFRVGKGEGGKEWGGSSGWEGGICMGLLLEYLITVEGRCETCTHFRGPVKGNSPSQICSFNLSIVFNDV